MTEEYNRLDTELADVSEHRTEYDANGNAVPVPVYVHQGTGRTAREHRMGEIKHQMALLAGVEGEAAMKRAARKDVLKAREITRQLTDSREIERRAHELAREDRINEAARTKAKFLHGNLG
jgi:ERCC4-related helicase